MSRAARRRAPRARLPPFQNTCWGRGARAADVRLSRRFLSSKDARLGASVVSCGREACSSLQSCPGSLVFALKAPLPLAHPVKGLCLEWLLGIPTASKTIIALSELPSPHCRMLAWWRNQATRESSHCP